MDIKSLKDKILQLAIQGKLVAQDENDEPASVLLEKIKAEKEQLIKDKVIKKEKPLPEISEEEKSFDLPKGWEWCRLIDICTEFLVPQRDKPKKFDGDIPWCRIEDIEGKFLNGTKSNQYVSQETVDNMNLKVNPIGTVICSCSASLGVQAIVTKPCCTNQTFIGLVPSKTINNVYLYYYLMSQKKYFYEIGAGTTIPYISKKKFQELKIYLPPLEEQERIVKKIDELFELIDELDNNKQELLENISNTRNKVLQLAIQGKLVEQCEDDEPASVLLERIKAEKEQLIKDKVIKKEKPLPEISEEEKSFNLPKGWEWCRFRDVLDVRDGTHDTPKYVSEGIPLITSKNISGNGIDYSNVKYISLNDHIEISKRSQVDNGDILFAMIGSIGNPVIVKKEIEFSIKNVALFKFYNDTYISNKYLYYYLLFSQDNMKKNAKGAVQSFVSLKYLREYLLPLPPLEEQKRIVAKVDLIMNYLDILQKEIESQEIILEDLLK